MFTGEDDTGEDEDEFWNTAVTIACHPGWDSQQLDATLKNFQPLAIDRQLFPDATVTVGGKDFVAHRSVLSAASPYFHCMFSSEMQEGEKVLFVPASLCLSSHSAAYMFAFYTASHP